MTTNQPDIDTSSWDRIDEHRMAHLDDVGLPGYAAVVVITRDGEERLAWPGVTPSIAQPSRTGPRTGASVPRTS